MLPKKKCLLLFVCLLIGSGKSFSQKISGNFTISGKFMNCYFINNSKDDLILIGLNREIQHAKFFTKDKIRLDTAPVNMPYPGIDASREWVVISANQSPGRDPISVYHFNTANVDFPDVKALNELNHLTLEISVRRLVRNTEIGKSEKVVVKLLYVDDLKSQKIQDPRQIEGTPESSKEIER